MDCNDCENGSPISFNIQSWINSQCNGCQDSSCLDSALVCYNGAALNCSGIENGDTLETVITKIDEQICSAIGDYSTYQKNCLPAWFGEEINDEATFVDAITSYACTIATNLETFTGVDFPQYQSEVQAQINTIDGPSLTCATAGVNTGDNLATILSKYCSKFNSLDTSLNLSDIDFGVCFSVIGTISTVKQGFTELISQICEVKTIAETGSAILPTFNNVGSCLASPTSSDSLYDTVIKIRTKLCSIDSSFDGTAITWGSCSTPSSTSLQDTIQLLADNDQTLTTGAVTEWSDDFIVAQVNPSNPCEGLSISLATPLTQDRFVAATDTDTTPGVLIDKLGSGNGVSISADDAETGIVISTTGEIRADVTDNTYNFLSQKLEGSSVNGITITPVYNPSTKKVTLQLSIDDALFCQAINDCVPAQCLEYSVENSSGVTQTIDWLDCAGNDSSINLPDGGSITLCARLDSVTGTGVTIIALGLCTTTTTMTP